MAVRDADLSVRVHAISLIVQIDHAGLLADDHEDQRSRVAKLVFDNEPRVRKAVGGFVRSLWKERVEQLDSQWGSAKAAKKKRAANMSEEDMNERFRYKALASLLVEISESLDHTPEAGSSRQKAVSTGAQMSTRARAAVESLRAEFEELRDWQGLVEYLLLDHSQAEDMWLMEEEEETLTLRVLAECVKQDDAVSLCERE